LSLTDFCFLKHGDTFGACGYKHSVGLPKSEGVDWATRPRPAWSAMAISHRFRLAGSLDMNCTAKRNKQGRAALNR
jgi:hypothetical protein